MVKLLIKTFIAHDTETENPKVRAAYGMLAGTMGIVCNLLLFLAKLIVGTFRIPLPLLPMRLIICPIWGRP